MTDTERDALIVAAWREHGALRPAANAVGVSYETVRQTLDRLGVDTSRGRSPIRGQSPVTTCVVCGGPVYRRGRVTCGPEHAAVHRAARSESATSVRSRRAGRVLATPDDFTRAEVLAAARLLGRPVPDGGATRTWVRGQARAEVLKALADGEPATARQVQERIGAHAALAQVLQWLGSARHAGIVVRVGKTRPYRYKRTPKGRES